MHGVGKVAGLLAGLLAVESACADWSGKGTFGGVLARGNTDTETINLVIDVQNQLERWTHKAGATMLRTVTDDVTSADRWELRGETQYSLTPRSYIFGALRYEDDAFTDFEYQATASGGYGYRFIMTDATKLEGQIGPGFRQTEQRLTGEKNEDLIARGALNFEHKLTDTTLVYDRLLVESGSDNTFVQNALGVEVKINDTFALGLDYTVRHNTDVLPGSEETDQVLTANLVYGF
jgi:putative salt-induced outer membrane protein